MECGGEGWIRTSVRLHGQIYSLLPLTTRPPLQARGGKLLGRGAMSTDGLKLARSPELPHCLKLRALDAIHSTDWPAPRRSSEFGDEHMRGAGEGNPLQFLI